MKLQRLLIVVLALLTACSPATLTPQATSTPLSTAMPVPTSTPLPPTFTPTFIPTATPTPTATLSLPQQIGLPDSLEQQFPLVENEARYWTLFGHPDVDGILPVFDMPAGDLIISSVVTFHYINARGEADFVYVPVTVINPGTKKCLNEGPSRPTSDCTKFLNPAGNGFLSGNKVLRDRITRENFVPSRKQIAELRFGYPSAVTQKTGSKGFLDYAVSEIYPGNILVKFAESGDSSLLPNRLLIPWFFESSHAYSIQVATSTPLPMLEKFPNATSTTAPPMKDISIYKVIKNQTFPLPLDTENENLLFCVTGDMNATYKWITPTILMTGTIDCHYLGGYVQLPLGIYDLEENRLVYWRLGILEDFTNTKYLALQAQYRFSAVLSQDGQSVKNELVIVSLGRPEQKNLQVVDTYNFAPYIDAYYADAQNLEALMKFIETGKPPDDRFIFPFYFGSTRDR